MSEVCQLAGQVKTSDLGPGDTITVRIRRRVPVLQPLFFVGIDDNGWEFILGPREKAMHFPTEESMLEFFRPHSKTLEGFRFIVEIDRCEAKGIAK